MWISPPLTRNAWNSSVTICRHTAWSQRYAPAGDRISLPPADCCQLPRRKIKYDKTLTCGTERSTPHYAGLPADDRLHTDDELRRRRQPAASERWRNAGCTDSGGEQNGGAADYGYATARHDETAATTGTLIPGFSRTRQSHGSHPLRTLHPDGGGGCIHIYPTVYPL